MVSTLLNFVRLFNRALEENGKQLEAEAKKNAAEKEKPKTGGLDKEIKKPLDEEVKKEKTKTSGLGKEMSERIKERTAP